jgi:hypothetical protein
MCFKNDYWFQNLDVRSEYATPQPETNTSVANLVTRTWVDDSGKMQLANFSAASAKCGTSFFDFRIEALAKAQSSYMITVVWGQIGNVLIRKTQSASILTNKRFFGNKTMLWR